MDKLNMESVHEYIELLWVNLKVSLRNSLEFIRVAFCYYSNIGFAKADISVILMYLFHNPYSISKRFLMKKGEYDVHTYGETPLTTMDLIAKECGIRKDDHFYELGSGRGRTCFWVNAFTGCNATGIEYIPDFIERANMIKNKLQIEGVNFLNEDYFEAKLSGVTVVYLYGSNLSDAAITRLTEHLSAVPQGTKIITVSYPLTDYAEGKKSFEVMKRFPARFTWGTADVYLQIKK